MACFFFGLAMSFHPVILLSDAAGKSSGEKTAVFEDSDRKTEEAPTTTAQQESDEGSLARASSILESHNSNMAGMVAAPSNPSMAPIMPLPAQLSLFTGPPVLTAALNQAFGQNQPQQSSLPSQGVQGHMQSMQSLLHADEPTHQAGPHTFPHTNT